MTPNHGYDPTDAQGQQSPHAGGQPGGQRPGNQQSAPGQQPAQPGAYQGQPAGQPTGTQPRSQPQGQPQSQPVPRGASTQPGQAPPRQGGRPPQQGAPAGGAVPQRSFAPTAGGTPAASGGQAPRQGRGSQPATRAGGGQSLFRPISLDEVAAEDVVTAERDTPIRTVVAKMAERDVGSVVVVDGDEPVGIVTDRKVALALEDAPDVAQRPAEELVGDDLVTVDQSMTIFEVLRTMSDHGIRRLPVVDEDNRLQGIVTLDDVTVLLGTELGNVAETIESQLSRL